MGRRAVRDQLFKLLFRVEFNEPEDMTEQERLFFELAKADRGEEGVKHISKADEEEIKAKFDLILDKLSGIDDMINEKTTGWKTTRMGKVDLTILRLAVFEICFDDSVPDNVAINEAVELAKKYGQDESAGFVNGVLAKFAGKES
ncbi:MAG: transcription antitermination factor NusB [Lachnospiraceae bacterium]|nr:transcription antitermination factor NusB [Lachnospiraceae bacterium]MBQ5376650.1 transcription antitermination factor NusB [Lachnospiraceae bacterium]